MLYHISGWKKLENIQPGEVFSLHPGPQGAEGSGVYFSEGAPRHSAAEGAQAGVAVVISIPTPTARGWYRSKTANSKKYGRPRTWHTKGKSISLKVLENKGYQIIAEMVSLG